MPNSIEIVAQDDVTLVLHCGNREVVVDKRRRIVRSESQILAHFDAIKSIDITHYSSIDAGPDYWAVALNLSWFSSISIGRTEDSTDASIAAAHLSTFTGKKVRAL